MTDYNHIDFEVIARTAGELYEIGAGHLACDLLRATSREAITAVHKDVLNSGYTDQANSISEAAGLY